MSTYQEIRDQRRAAFWAQLVKQDARLVLKGRTFTGDGLKKALEAEIAAAGLQLGKQYDLTRPQPPRARHKSNKMTPATVLKIKALLAKHSPRMNSTEIALKCGVKDARVTEGQQRHVGPPRPDARSN